MIVHDIDQLETRLAEGEVRLVFMKKDGTVREARGTRASHLIPPQNRPKGVRRPSPQVLCFFDLDKGEWRCLRRDSLLGFVE